MTAATAIDAHVVSEREFTLDRTHALADIVHIITAASLEGVQGQVVINLGPGGTITSIKVVSRARLRTLSHL